MANGSGECICAPVRFWSTACRPHLDLIRDSALSQPFQKLLYVRRAVDLVVGGSLGRAAYFHGDVLPKYPERVLVGCIVAQVNHEGSRLLQSLFDPSDCRTFGPRAVWTNLINPIARSNVKEM